MSTILASSLILGVNANASNQPGMVTDGLSYVVNVRKVNVRDASCKQTGTLSSGSVIFVEKGAKRIKCKINGKVIYLTQYSYFDSGAYISLPLTKALSKYKIPSQVEIKVNKSNLRDENCKVIFTIEKGNLYEQYQADWSTLNGSKPVYKNCKINGKNVKMVRLGVFEKPTFVAVSNIKTKTFLK